MKPALRILVADTDGGRCATLAAVLRLCGYGAIEFALEGASLPAAVAEHDPDLVLIDVDAPDRDVLEQLDSLQREVPRPVVMFSQDEDEGTIARAVEAGVSAYIVDGLASARVKPIIDVAIAHFRQQQAMRRELEHAKSTLDERKHVDRAKALLMSGRGITEPEAYAVLRKAAMDRKQRVGEVAAGMLAAASLLAPAAASNPASRQTTAPPPEPSPAAPRRSR
ncbi:ANTAR domain-containing response regulator [Phycisphaera mikurensis]|uniref:Putative response regulator n=1 Tax=Phycisphaera mikurensis (strain NBRC 102666 / KCTC 22515 / FYK2301M01) TaxID=1142394 RepID=I0IG05_PHYMF|nr:ANTAR domain-containing protein [Phycisphaera mikurensis]MBB6440421.1 response regulator NasT [Phycisphaera mikurensis]BAM04193.1 putative response regulator [Phycisphaera mikurensis NBRC 102666]